MPFKFEKLKISQMAIDVVYEIHNLTRTFPKEELFILTAQMKRAADSVSLNIAEGWTGQTNAEQKRFLGFFVTLCFGSGELFLPRQKKRFNFGRYILCSL